ncbi:MAG: hypothetical protein AAGF57_03250 [Pseudomonadota bacterium]
MAHSQESSLPKEKFLVIAVNLLHRQFIDATRTQAKQVYRELAAQRTINMTTLKMEDESTLRVHLAMDSSEFRGQLNFGSFKASLSILLGNLASTLQEEKEVTVFSVQDRPSSVIFGITGVTVDRGVANVMVLGSELGQERGLATLRLMYLDPSQFVESSGQSNEELAS